MVNPRPKFTVGEEVTVIRESDNAGTTVNDEVSTMDFYRNFRFSYDGVSEDESYIGWVYQLAGFPGLYAKEEQLRKRPPNDRIKWEDCEFQPYKEGIEA